MVYPKKVTQFTHNRTITWEWGNWKGSCNIQTSTWWPWENMW